MEVTSANFKEILPEVEQVIKNCSFLAIDCELTGLNIVSESPAFDTPQQYYEKVLKNSKDFLVIQYGISAFRYDPVDHKFKHQSYNFYIFRRPINRNIPDQRFLCQTSSIHFLITQGFDFNKLFKSGISYLNVSEEKNYRDKLEDRERMRSHQQSSSSTADVIPIPEESQPFIDDVLKQIDDFLKSDDGALELPKCNAFVRRLVYQTVGQKYANRVNLQTKQMKNKDRILVATKFKSSQQQDEMFRKQREEELGALDDFIGFTKVLKMMVDSGKLVVGHNMFLDFVHTIDKFLTPLTNDYEDFKECAQSLFKNILDTKFMASSERFKDMITSTVLADLLETTSKDPFQIQDTEVEMNGLSYSIDDPKEHEAGYDAFITGLAFLSMWNYLDEPQKHNFKDFTSLEPYLNKLFMMASRDTHVNLAGPDPNPSRDHVFYVTFPKEWKLSNLTELFSPFGSVYVAWINDSSAFVALHKKEQAAVALSTLSQSDTYSIMTYHNRQMQVSGNKSVTVTDHSGRKRSSEKSFVPSKKKLKTDKDGFSNSSESLNPTVEPADNECEMFMNKRGVKKTFTEDNAWE